ncbi:putative endolysin [Acinetobacter phage Scuro]|nr:putative endolysin [Acinetobacter phage Scuro]
MKMTDAGFKHIREKLGRLSQDQVDGINRYVNAMDQDKAITYAQAAYVLATVWHETDAKMSPIEEYGKGKGRVYGTWYKNSKGQLYAFKNGSRDSVYLQSEYPHLYYGRGDTQNTWFDNYEKLSKVFNVDFLQHPELLLTEGWSTKATIYSMKVGLYTGRKLSDYIYQSKKDFVNARRIINGTDRANKIAKYAEIFEYALRRP